MASPDHDKSSHPPPDDANPPENENEIAVLDVTGANEVQPLRRSGRRPLPSSRLESLDPTRTPEPRPSKIPAAVDETGRNPKRKTRESQKCHIDIPSNLLSEALKPLEAKDIEEWEGWIELESEPAFFNIILRDLGVENVKAQELFSIDQQSIDFLPKPVFGLIFLFQYMSSLDETEDEEDTTDVWFANQTVHNACATVALLNIIMNAPEIQIGDELKQFKEATKDLSTALRGYCLSTNAFIRSIHNSFTRRMDHLNADLALENEATARKSKKPKAVSSRAVTYKAGTATKKVKARAKKKDVCNNAFHYLAYVPAGGYVWELDGMKTKPYRLGPIHSEDWTAVARPQIDARMLQYEDSQLSFNLLALCQSPLAVHSQKTALSLASLRCVTNALHKKFPAAAYPTFNIDDPANLTDFPFSQEDLLNLKIPESVVKITAQHDPFPYEQLHMLYEQYTKDAKAAMVKYHMELMSVVEDEQRVKGRKKDYGAALHQWVTKLAEKGVLEDVIKDMETA